MDRSIKRAPTQAPRRGRAARLAWLVGLSLCAQAAAAAPAAALSAPSEAAASPIAAPQAVALHVAAPPPPSLTRPRLRAPTLTAPGLRLDPDLLGDAPRLRQISSTDALLEAVILTFVYAPHLIYALIEEADGVFFSYGVRHVGDVTTTAAGLQSLDLGIAYFLGEQAALNLRLRGSVPQLTSLDLYLGLELYSEDGRVFGGPYTGLGALSLPRSQTSKGLDTFAALWGMRVGSQLTDHLRAGIDLSAYLDFFHPTWVYAPAASAFIEVGSGSPAR